MMRTIKVRNLEIGAGMPKICAPIVGKNVEEILDSAKKLREADVDLAEWRADYFEDVTCGGNCADGEMVADFEKVIAVARTLREELGDLPLLFTFRTKAEGGEREIALADYVRLNVEMAKSEPVDLVDVELFAGDEAVSDVILAAREAGTKVVLSNHDFEKTPPQEEIVGRLRRMQELGGDILKIAVMPTCRRDVLTLLSVTEEMDTKYADRPLITMSMGGMGAVSRVCGEVFGSAVTFGAVGAVSAPGQMEAGKLRELLKALHEGGLNHHV